MKIEEGSYYHIYNRGNNRGIIFFQESDYVHFLNQFNNYLKSSVDIYVYCLMPNHFHFFIKINDKTTFEKGIKNFLISYVKYVNFKYYRVGGLFQGRYKASPVKTDSYFTQIVTYIHQNPLILPNVEKLEDYKHSSYREYLNDVNCYLNKDEVINWFGNLEQFRLIHEQI
ncbi:MAG: transposase [Chitinophagaceae bacterium]|nr:MAG: transposase [Chitinophagaceae bacterium]